MTDLHERSIITSRKGQLHDTGPAPPAESPPSGVPRPDEPTWPHSAKIVVAVLAVATLLAAIGTFFALSSGDDEVADQQEQIDVLEAEQARLTTELESANARVVALTSQRDDLNDRIATLDSELSTAQADVDQLTADRTTLTAERAELQSELAAAEAEVADIEARLDLVTNPAATLDERLSVIDVRVAGLLTRATTAEQERDALLELFPIEFESSLRGVDVRGDWNLRWDEAYCTGFPTCGADPSFTELAITQTPEGWLRASADGVFDTGLFAVEGALYGITQSTTAAPSCGLTPRTAHVGITMYARDVTVTDDGTHLIDDLGATYVIDAPATATCPAGLAVYSAALTPIG